MSYSELRTIENLARIGAHFDTGPEGDPVAPRRWGPASFWRAGLAVLAALIFIVLLFRLIG